MFPILLFIVSITRELLQNEFITGKIAMQYMSYKFLYPTICVYDFLFVYTL